MSDRAAPSPPLLPHYARTRRKRTLRRCVLRQGRRRGEADGGSDDAGRRFSLRVAQDMSSINNIVGDTKVMKALNTEHRVQGRRIDELQTRMEEELESTRRDLERWRAPIYMLPARGAKLIFETMWLSRRPVLRWGPNTGRGGRRDLHPAPLRRCRQRCPRRCAFRMRWGDVGAQRTLNGSPQCACAALTRPPAPGRRVRQACARCWRTLWGRSRSRSN